MWLVPGVRVVSAVQVDIMEFCQTFKTLYLPDHVAVSWCVMGGGGGTVSW